MPAAAKLVRWFVTVWAIAALATVPSSRAHRASQGPPSKPPKPVATVDIGGTAGGAQLGDVDGDGTVDAVTLRGGRIVAVSSTGKAICDRFVGATDIAAVKDLDGDGRAEVVFIDRHIRSLEAFDATTGVVRWRYLFAESVDLAVEYVRVAEVSSAHAGLETVVFPDYSHSLGDAYGYFLSSTGELYARPLVKNVNGNQLNFPSIAIANVDGVGDPEVVVVGRPKLMVFASTGQLISELDFRAGDPEGRHYGALTLANVDSDPELEAVVVADRIALVTPEKSHAIAVFDLVPTVKEVWRYVAPHADALESIPGGVADFDGDGRAEVAVDHFDGSTQAIEIFKPRAGTPGTSTPIARLADTYAWDSVDLGTGGGGPTLLASSERQREPSLSYKSRLVFVAMDSTDRFVPIGDPIPAARYATRPLRVLDRGDLASSIPADRTGVVVVRSPFPSTGPSSVMTYDARGETAVGMELRSIDRGQLKVVDLGARPGTVRAVAAPSLYLVAEGTGEEASDTLAFFRWDPVKRGLARLSSFRASGFADAAPTAADLDGDGRADLLVRLPGRRIAAYAIDSTTGRARELWEADGNTRPVVDVAADPRASRVFVVAPDKRDRAMLVAHASDGRVLWRTKFTDLPSSAKPEVVVGQFTGSGPRDVWVSAPRSKSWLVDGSNGRVIWESSAVFTYDNRAAVADVDGDGADDLIVVSNLTYGVYSGRTGQPIGTPVDVRKPGGDLFATPLLASEKTVVLVGRAALAKASIAGKPVWQLKRSTERTTADILAAIVHDPEGHASRVGGNYGDSDRFACYDLDDGKLVFSSDLVPVTDIVAADVNGDHQEDFVFGTSDGRVVALDSSTGREIWAIDVQAFAGTPVLAGSSLFVPLADGTVRVFAL